MKKDNLRDSMFELITQVSGLSSLYSSSIYSYGCISNRCDLGKDVWIQYYRNEKMGTATFSVGDSINMMDDISTIMLYVEHGDKAMDKTYDVYRYNGVLQIDRRIVGNLRNDILLNIDEIIVELKRFLHG